MEMSKLTDRQIIKKLEEFDTATICNVVATYAGIDLCLSLYDAWYGEYYTDTSLHCMYPELGPICGYAATAWYSDKKPQYTDIERWVLPEHLNATLKPVILVAKQSYSSGLKKRAGLFGGNMTAQFKAFGVVGVVTNGPMRDLEEIREQKVQYLATGLTSGHGALQLRAAGIPVKIAGMIVQLEDIIHMDQCGAAKFPAKYLLKVLEYATELAKREANNKATFQDPEFTLTKWKASIESKKKNI